MKPGRFHGETGGPIGVRPGDGRDLPLRTDEGSGDGWYLAVGDTRFAVQLSDITLPVNRPVTFTVDLVRKDGDRTSRDERTVPQSGDRKWAATFTIDEYVDPDDGLFRFHVSHDGTSTVDVGKVVVKGINQRAQDIHDKGGYNRWSDGEIR